MTFTSHKPAGTPAADNKDKDRAVPVGGPTNSQTPATSSSRALTGAVDVPHAVPSAEQAAPVVSSGPVHFADREHLTVPDDMDLDIPAFLQRSA